MKALNLNKNMKKTLLISLFVGLGVLLASQMISAAAVSCGCGKGSGSRATSGGCQMAQKVIDAKDFAAWQNISKDCQCANCNAKQIINKDNFAKFQEMHKLMLAGKTAEAQKIRAELGLTGNCLNGAPKLGQATGCNGKCGTGGCACKPGQSCSGKCSGGSCGKNTSVVSPNVQPKKSGCGCQNKK